MGKVKVILWDIDGTLLNFEEAEKAAIRRCFAIHGLGVCTDEMLAQYSGINRKYWEKLERGELTKPEILVGRFLEFFKERGLDINKAEAFNADYQIQLGNTICFEDGALEVIHALRDRGLRQFAVTNGTLVAQTRKLAKSGLDQLLEKAFISDEIGIEKPMKGFFDVVWKEIGAYDKDEVMIVGDSLTSDMQGGNHAGILCCWYNPKKQINHKKDLRIDKEICSLKELLEFI